MFKSNHIWSWDWWNETLAINSSSLGLSNVNYLWAKYQILINNTKSHRLYLIFWSCVDGARQDSCHNSLLREAWAPQADRLALQGLCDLADLICGTGFAHDRETKCGGKKMKTSKTTTWKLFHKLQSEIFFNWWAYSIHPKVARSSL